MSLSDPIDVAAHRARAALGMMDRHKIPANPRNFAVWYAYVGHFNPGLTQSIDAILDSGKGFSDEVNAQLSQQFQDSSSEENELREVGRRIEEAVARMIGYMETAQTGAAAYGQTLESFSGQLSNPISVDAMSRLVTDIMAATRQMIAINEQLSHRLAVTANEAARMREDIDHLRHEATVDHLTKLANRKLFDLALRQAQHEADENKSPLSLLMVDIDFFKAFNDTHGHQMGDQVLKLVGHVLRDCVRDTDTAARYGGEEFAVVIPGASLDVALEKAEMIRTQVAGRKVANRRTGTVLGQVTLSVGVAIYEPGETLNSFVHRADEALYQAKRSGRNRVCSQLDLPPVPA